MWSNLRDGRLNVLVGSLLGQVTEAVLREYFAARPFSRDIVGLEGFLT
jgi:hypothetical protein